MKFWGAFENWGVCFVYLFTFYNKNNHRRNVIAQHNYKNLQVHSNFFFVYCIIWVLMRVETEKTFIALTIIPSYRKYFSTLALEWFVQGRHNLAGHPQYERGCLREYGSFTSNGLTVHVRNSSLDSHNKVKHSRLLYTNWGTRQVRSEFHSVQVLPLFLSLHLQ